MTDDIAWLYPTKVSDLVAQGGRPGPSARSRTPEGSPAENCAGGLDSPAAASAAASADAGDGALSPIGTPGGARFLPVEELARWIGLDGSVRLDERLLDLGLQARSGGVWRPTCLAEGMYLAAAWADGRIILWDALAVARALAARAVEPAIVRVPKRAVTDRLAAGRFPQLRQCASALVNVRRPPRRQAGGRPPEGEGRLPELLELPGLF